MRKKSFVFIVALCGILGAASASQADTGSRWQVVYNSESTEVKVYGPPELTRLAREAIRERRPGVAIEEYTESFKNKVWIEGTTGAGYMELSPGRVKAMRAAKTRGQSVYAALCAEQQGVISKTVGAPAIGVAREEKRTVAERTYVRRVVVPPPVYVSPPVVVGGYYPYYGYAGYSWWRYGHRYPYYRGWKGHDPYHAAYGGHYVSGPYHRAR